MEKMCSFPRFVAFIALLWVSTALHAQDAASAPRGSTPTRDSADTAQASPADSLKQDLILVRSADALVRVENSSK